MKSRFFRIFFKTLLIFSAVIIVSAMGFFIYYLAVTSSSHLDESALKGGENTVCFYDDGGHFICQTESGTTFTPAEKIPDNLKNAFVAIEDKRFYQHHGVDFKGLIRAGVKNALSFSYKEGASTITQQLIKNTHLSSDKNLTRKLKEIKLASDLEKRYGKEQIMETYLNTIYFGENCYGITSAAALYFGKSPEELSLNECAALAATVKAPRDYSPASEGDKKVKRRNLVLKEMANQGFISEEDYIKNAALSYPVTCKNKNVKYDYFYLAEKELENITEDNPYARRQLKVYTYFNGDFQDFLDDGIKNTGVSAEVSALITDKNSHVVAFSSTCPQYRRQIGSTIKPLLVYAPAIERNVIYPCSKILDEKTDFNGYSPKNYGDRYSGYVSVKTALSKSLNVPAVKVLQATGVENSVGYLKKTDIPVTDNDNSLAVSLGATEKGATLKELVSSYGVFKNGGYHLSARLISRVEDNRGNIIYRASENPVKVFGEETAYLVGDMMEETVKSGTAKKLDGIGFLKAKTGTVGNSDGNTDAYCVSFDGNFTVGVWMGKADNGKMPNTVTGGTYPASFSAKVWKNIVNGGYETTDISRPEKVTEKDIDAISYEEENLILEADENSPKRYRRKELFKADNLPKSRSSRFSSPKVEKAELSYNSYGISVKFCLAKQLELKIFKECDGVKKLVFDTLKNGKTCGEFLDKEVQNGKTYAYTLLPYFNADGKIVSGKEVYLPRVKYISENLDKWWREDLSFNVKTTV